MTVGVQVYGIGNPLIDVMARVGDEELKDLDLSKGTTALIDNDRGTDLLNYLAGREVKYSCGGAEPNTIVTLASLGVRSAMAGMVGNDELGRIYHERLQSKQVISDLVSCEEETGTCIVLVTPDYERTMNTRLGACRRFSPAHLKHESIAAADYLYFSGFMWDTEPQRNAVKAAIETARRADTKVVFDLADPFAVERHYEDFIDLIKNSVDLLLANREEARLLLGIDNPEQAVKELARDCLVAAVKNCAEGSCIASGSGDFFVVDAYRVEAVDSTGAGDNYAAGFLYALINGYSLSEAGQIASYVAAQIVRQTGAQFEDERIAEIGQEIKEGHWR